MLGGGVLRRRGCGGPATGRRGRRGGTPGSADPRRRRGRRPGPRRGRRARRGSGRAAPAATCAGQMRVRVGLGGVLEVAQQVSRARLVPGDVLPARVEVGWAAQRGPGTGPFPGSLPPNSACTFQCTELSGDLCRVRDGVRVDPVMARRADDERLAPHFRHERGPRRLARSRFPERFEAGDLVDCHRGAGLAELAFPCCGAS